MGIPQTLCQWGQSLCTHDTVQHWLDQLRFHCHVTDLFFVAGYIFSSDISANVQVGESCESISESPSRDIFIIARLKHNGVVVDHSDVAVIDAIYELGLNFPPNTTRMLIPLVNAQTEGAWPVSPSYHVTP